MPVRKYARAPEIYEHSRRIGRHFGLYDRALFQTVISRMEWQESEGRWLVETDRGDRIRARFVVLAGGPLSRPKLPGIPGIESFKGHSFHTSRWDYAYTGGNAGGGLAGLADKRVGIIGTGATAVQCVPHLGRSSKELYVFQRTPSAIGVRDDRPTDQSWAQNLKPGWQRERMDNFTAVISGEPFEQDLVQDGWTGLLGEILLAPRRQPQPLTSMDEALKVIEQADYRKMEEIRARVDAIVKDETTASALKPWYKAFCKRPCFHDEYLDTFNRANVHLVDTQGARRRAHHRERRRRRRQGLRARLPDLCQWLRGRHGLRPPDGIRGLRPGRHEPVRTLARGRQDTARVLQSRIPELLPHRHGAGRPERKFPARHRRTVSAHRLCHRRSAQARRPGAGADTSRRERLGRRGRQGGARPPDLSR
ncbi:cation diffusion facilitator CzcD-associated flavoprotein CzcO [Bradyrhizobium sp. LM2.7]